MARERCGTRPSKLGSDRAADAGEGPACVTAPDRTVRLGYLPEGRDGALWEIAAHGIPFGPPH
ncbi:hypothetical protein [Streptomyces megasporus]|uniref:hypothetical protein n=1 Tax=Streptomyces megasporus TaxID=44060 RepID=UPI000A4D64B4|nr:hypothetical protein [Streptomyces megasporus]